MEKIEKNNYSGCLLVRTDTQLEEAKKDFPKAVGLAIAHVETLPIIVPKMVEAIVLTSANAVPAITHINLPIIAVGEQTAEAAKAIQKEVILIGDGDSIQMAEKLVNTHLQCQTILHVHGVTYRKDWYNLCIQQGIKVLETTGYRLVPIKKLPTEVAEGLKTKKLYTVILLSVQALENLIYLATLENIDTSELTAVVLSKRIGEAATQFGKVVVAKHPTRKALRQAVESIQKT
ncbi:MAG: uroporphyrinogen-III synthase [Alphaproteobacteria bacterium]|nr:uroporphyrinogen-III synthase [Alphaproteobacteria bacterium]MDD9919242.1 uroporphyrinogen-III synthase [Alphaproteobacteria bacterium]